MDIVLTSFVSIKFGSGQLLIYFVPQLQLSLSAIRPSTLL